MNKNELYAGNVFKNYRDLSKRLFEDEKPKTSDSKIAELKVLDSLCTYHKEGNKFVLDEIFPIPHKISDRRTLGNYNKYTSLVKNILLCTYPDGTIVRTSTTNLLSLCGLTTERYIAYRQDESKIIDSIFDGKYSNITKENKQIVLKFVNFVYHKKVSYIIPYVLKSMANHIEIESYSHNKYYYRTMDEEWIEDNDNIIQSVLEEQKTYIIQDNPYCASSLYNDYRVNSKFYYNVKRELEDKGILSYYKPYIITFIETLTGIGADIHDDRVALNQQMVADLKHNIDVAVCFDINELREQCKYVVDMLFNIKCNNNRFIDKDECIGVVIGTNYVGGMADYMDNDFDDYRLGE